jgi:hypothetical protein
LLKQKFFGKDLGEVLASVCSGGFFCHGAK